MRGKVTSLADAVRQRRIALSLRQTDLAELAGCSSRFIHTVEQGKATVRLDKLLSVLEVLGLGLRVVPGHGEISGAPSADNGTARSR